VSIRLRATYPIPSGHQCVPAGIDGGVCRKPVSLAAGPWHLADLIGVPAHVGGPNDTKQGMAFAVFEPRGASG